VLGAPHSFTERTPCPSASPATDNMRPKTCTLVVLCAFLLGNAAAQGDACSAACDSATDLCEGGSVFAPPTPNHPVTSLLSTALHVCHPEDKPDVTLNDYLPTNAPSGPARMVVSLSAPPARSPPPSSTTTAPRSPYS